jgi:hypothetical protein
MYLPSYVSCVTFALYALSVTTQAIAGASDHDELELISPEDGNEYYIGGTMLVQARIPDEELKDPSVKLYFQRAIPKPDVNKLVAECSASELSEDGYKLPVSSDLQGDKKTNRYHIRARFTSNDGEEQYVDSGVFKIYPH